MTTANQELIAWALDREQQPGRMERDPDMWVTMARLAYALKDALAAVPAATLAVVEEAIKRADREQLDGLSTRSLLREVVQTGEMPDVLPVPAPTEADADALIQRAERVSGALEEYEFEGIAGDAAATMNELIDMVRVPAPKTQDGEAREALAVTKQTVWHKDQFYVTVDTVANEFVTISEELLVKLMTESGWVLVPSDPATPVFEAMGLPPVPPFPSIHPEGGE